MCTKSFPSFDFVNTILTEFSHSPGSQFLPFAAYVRSNKTSLHLSIHDTCQADGACCNQKNPPKRVFYLPPAGVELATSSLGRNRSIQLSYGGVN